MTKANLIKGVDFPDYDLNWKGVENFIKTKGFREFHILAPVEYSLKFMNSVPYEWSYWTNFSEFDILVVQKCMLEQISDGFLLSKESQMDVVFSNSVFDVYLKKTKATEVDIVRIRHSLIHLGGVFLRNLYYKIKKFTLSTSNDAILLVTANQCGNIGDDAITMASMDLLKSVYPNSQIVIDKAPASKKIIRKSSLVVLGGGGIFYDHCFRNAQNYCQYLLFAKEAGVKTAVIGVGAQGIATELGKQLYQNALNECELISVRDNFSYKYLKEKLNLHCPVYLNQDVVFSLTHGRYEFTKKLHKKPKLIFSLLDSTDMPTSDKTKNYQNAQLSCIRYLTERFDVELFVQSIDDLNMYEEFKQIFGLKIKKFKYQETRKVIDYYKTADLVITARLHGFIFAALAHVPVITVASPELNFKLGSMINLSLPSAKTGLIPLRKYSESLLKLKVEAYFAAPQSFTVDQNELQENIELSREVVQLLAIHVKLPEVANR